MNNVLTSGPLLIKILSYQPGICKDFIPISRLPPLITTRRDQEDFFPITKLKNADAILCPWYATYGLHRIPRLFEQVPHVQELILHHAAYFGLLDVISSYNSDKVFVDNLVDLATGGGHECIICYLQSRGHVGYTRRTIYIAAIYGQLDILKREYLNNRLPLTSRVMDWAASAGQLAVLEWLHTENIVAFTTDAIDCAAANGHLNVVKWLNANRKEGWTALGVAGAAGNGHINVVKYFHENNLLSQCPPNAFSMAVTSGHLEIVKYLTVTWPTPTTSNAMDTAARRGHFDIVQAAMYGHLEIVQYLDKNRHEGCTILAMDRAALKGHLSVVKYLHMHRSEGCTPLAMTMAAKNGHLNVVKYLHLNRKEGFERRALQNSKHPNVVSYLKTISSEYIREFMGQGLVLCEVPDNYDEDVILPN